MMNDNYILMHKNRKCGILSIQRDSGAFVRYKAIDSKWGPFLGNDENKYMSVWWKHRAVPGSRRDMTDVIRRAGCETNPEYLAKNLALSITDTYWICPMDIELSWEDVSLHRCTDEPRDVVTFHNGTSYDPNASLGGEMSKYWDMSGTVPILVKKAYEHYGQQSINELFATEVHARQGTGVPYASYYKKESDDNAVLSCCNAFTSESIEFVSAYEVLRSRKLKPGRSDCDSFIDICEERGLDRQMMQRFIDYMILTDFAISNTDRHLQNFGVLRNADSMELIGPAPLFDSGNSMFYNEKPGRPLSRAELLDRSIRSFQTSEEKILKHVSDKKAVDTDRLPASSEIRDFYASRGIPEDMSEFIAGSYSNKLGLLRDFQKGVSISLYSVKNK